jgi:hypothetical protein
MTIISSGSTSAKKHTFVVRYPRAVGSGKFGFCMVFRWCGQVSMSSWLPSPTVCQLKMSVPVVSVNE